MYAKKRRYTPLIVVLLLLLTLGTTGTTVAKYIHAVQLKDKVTFTAKLAETIILQESKANRQPDGSYRLDENTQVSENKYELIPGLDIPKDPYITITDKTPIKAYLFVELVDRIGNQNIRYYPDENWQLVKDGENPFLGKNGGWVYVYAKNGSPVQLDNTNCPADKIYILQNNTIYVDQGLNSETMVDQSLAFYACLSEIPTNNGAAADLKTIYENAYLPQS